jgi:predicted permease
MPDLDVGALRVPINRLVLAVFLPALNFEVIYTASVGKEFWQVPALALGGLAVTLAAGALVYGRLPIARPARGALILAGAFGNVTYFGLPVLRGLLPAAVPVGGTRCLSSYQLPAYPLAGSCTLTAAACRYLARRRRAYQRSAHSRTRSECPTKT